MRAEALLCRRKRVVKISQGKLSFRFLRCEAQGSRLGRDNPLKNNFPLADLDWHNSLRLLTILCQSELEPQSIQGTHQRDSKLFSKTDSMLFIVIPAYNEEKTIGRVISGLFDHGYRNIVVVDDGSVDRTSEVAKKLGVFVLRHELNRGQGAALQTGNEFAILKGADIVVHFDGDGQLNPADIEIVVDAMNKNGADVALGSRFLDNRSNLPWTKKHLVFPCARVINRIFTGVSLTDVHNGFRVLSRKALDKIFINQDRMAHNSEIIKQIKKNNLKYIEAPVQVTYNEYGQGLRGGIKVFFDLVQDIFIK